MKIRIVLTQEEYELLDKIAYETKMDCWFDIRTRKDGYDWVYDLENNRYVTLRYGVGQLFDGLDLAYEKRNLCADELKTLQLLAEKLKLPMPTLIEYEEDKMDNFLYETICIQQGWQVGYFEDLFEEENDEKEMIELTKPISEDFELSIIIHFDGTNENFLEIIEWYAKQDYSASEYMKQNPNTTLDNALKVESAMLDLYFALAKEIEE